MLENKNNEINRLIKEEQKTIDSLTYELDLRKGILLNKNPIEKKEKICIDKADNAAAVRECVYIAEHEWNEEIKKYLNELKKVTTKEQYQLITESQNLWLKQNKKDRDIIYELIFNHGGTMYFDLAAGDNEELVKNRAEFLKWVYNVHTDNITSNLN